MNKYFALVLAALTMAVLMDDSPVFKLEIVVTRFVGCLGIIMLISQYTKNKEEVRS